MNMVCKANFFLKLFGITKVPMIFFSGATVSEMSDEKIVVYLPFKKRNKNHLNSMYFGALCVGADVAGGFLAMRHITNVKNGKGTLVFKDMHAQFLKRPEGKTFFTCTDGPAILAAVKKAEETLERVDIPVTIIATVPSKQEDPVAKFVLTLSLKVRI